MILISSSLASTGEERINLCSNTLSLSNRYLCAKWFKLLLDRTTRELHDRQTRERITIRQTDQCTLRMYCPSFCLVQDYKYESVSKNPVTDTTVVFVARPITCQDFEQHEQ